MSFIWRTNAQDTQIPPVLSHAGLLLIRILLSSILALGFLYASLVLTTFSRYGDVMDRAWKRRIDGWVQERIFFRTPAPYPPRRSSPVMSYREFRGRTPYDFEEPRVAPDWYIPLSRPYKTPKAKSFEEDWGFNRPSSPLENNDRDPISPQTYFAWAANANAPHNNRWGVPEEDEGGDYTSKRSRSLPPLPEEDDVDARTPPDLASVPRAERPPVRMRRPSVDDEGRPPSEGSYGNRRHSFAVDDQVRFRSPLVSARASSVSGSDSDADFDPARLALLPDASVGPGPPPSAQGPSVSPFSREFSSAREPTSRDNTPLADRARHENAVASPSLEHQVPRSGDVEPHFDSQMQGKVVDEGS